jgi:hypothetical protein
MERILLVALLTVQLVLGVESWLARFHVPQADLPQLLPVPMHAAWVRTAHYVVGALLFATTAAVALRAQRKTGVVLEAEAIRPRELEGVL